MVPDELQPQLQECKEAVGRLKSGRSTDDRIVADINLLRQFEKVLGKDAEPGDFGVTEQELADLLNAHPHLAQRAVLESVHQGKESGYAIAS